MRGTVRKAHFLQGNIFWKSARMGRAGRKKLDESDRKSGVSLGEFAHPTTTPAKAVCRAKHLGNEFGISLTQVEPKNPKKTFGLQAEESQMI